jgi:hypothetical protein
MKVFTIVVLPDCRGPDIITAGNISDNFPMRLSDFLFIIILKYRTKISIFQALVFAGAGSVLDPDPDFDFTPTLS